MNHAPGRDSGSPHHAADCANPTARDLITSRAILRRRTESAGNGTTDSAADETEEAIGNRLKTYQDKTAPLIVYYEKAGLLKNFLSLNSRETVENVKIALKGA